MQDRTGEDKQVPDRVHVADLFQLVEDDAHRVADAAREEQDQPAGLHRGKQRLDGQHDAPAHRDIEDHLDFAEAVQHHRVKDDTDDGKSPQDAEERPAERAAQGHQQIGRVRARDQQENGRVVKDAEHALCTRRGERVVECGHRVENDQRRAVERDRDHAVGVADMRRVYDQRHQRGD